MKKLYSSFCFLNLLTLLFLLVSCETEKLIFTGPYHVRFTKESAFERESYSKVIDIEVHNAGPALDEDIVVNYTIVGDARPGIDYEIMGEPGRVVIPAGKYFGYIRLKLINNANNILRSQSLTFTLQQTSTNKVAVGQGLSQIGKTFTFTIFDDCILGGTYQGSRSAFSIPTKNITITSIDCKQYTLSNWNVGLFYWPFDFDLVFIDNFDNTITIPSQEEEWFGDDSKPIHGIGSINPTTGQITISLTIEEFPELSPFVFTLTRE
jgi:hypothetical protein